MDILELGAIGELVGGVAVVVTLLYLAIQVKHNTAQNRSQNSSNLRATVMAGFDPVYQHPDVFFRSIRGDSDLSDNERELFGFMLMRILVAFQEGFFKDREGGVGPEWLHTYAGVLRNILMSPVARRRWSEIKGLFAPPFQRFVDAALAEPLGDPANAAEA